MATVELNNENFENEVLKSDKPVVVDFWAAWCGPCRMMGPIFEELSDDMSEVKFAKLSTEEHGDKASEHNIMSIPTLVVFKEGKEVGRISGVMPKEDLKEKINGFL
ncbi:MAG: thioredoxin [Candidatus Woesearchaeota archaeon]